MIKMKEDLKNIILMGLGAMSLTTEKASELKEELLKKGLETYDKTSCLNEELKHIVKEKMKDNVTVVVEPTKPTKEDIKNSIKTMSEEDKKELLNLLKEKKAKKNE